MLNDFTHNKGYRPVRAHKDQNIQHKRPNEILFSILLLEMLKANLIH